MRAFLIDCHTTKIYRLTFLLVPIGKNTELTIWCIPLLLPSQKLCPYFLLLLHLLVNQSFALSSHWPNHPTYCVRPLHLLFFLLLVFIQPVCFCWFVKCVHKFTYIFYFSLSLSYHKLCRSSCVWLNWQEKHTPRRRRHHFLFSPTQLSCSLSLRFAVCLHK